MRDSRDRRANDGAFVTGYSTKEEMKMHEADEGVIQAIKGGGGGGKENMKAEKEAKIPRKEKLTVRNTRRKRPQR